MGTLTLARDGYRSRISDLLNASERDFISITESGFDDPGPAERIGVPQDAPVTA